MSPRNYPKTNWCLASAVSTFLALSAVANSVQGQELDRVAKYISDETSILIRIDPKALGELVGGDVESATDPEQTVLQLQLKKTLEILGNDPIWLVASVVRATPSVQIVLRDPDNKRIDQLKKLWDFPTRYQGGPEPPVIFRKLPESNSSAASRSTAWKELMSRNLTAGESTIQFGCLPPVHLYETYAELKPELPNYLGGGTVSLLTDGFKNLSGTFHLKTGQLTGTIDSASPEAAAAFASRATQLLASISSNRDDNQNLARAISERFAQSTFQLAKNQIRWQVPADEQWQPAKLLRLALGSGTNRTATRRLRSLTLGILNYESANSQLPPPRGTNEPSGLSWRVHILPFLGQNELKLYKKFALDEPWDSRTNIKLLSEMPDIYHDYGSKLLAPANAKPGYTTVVAPISDNTIIGSPKRVTFGSISDGTSNTVLLVVVKNSLSVPWTAPQDYVFDRTNPAAGLKFTSGKVPVAWCDGSTDLLSSDNDNEAWLGSFEMNDGRVIRAK